MARGGYTFDQIKQMTSTELLFLYHYQELVKTDQQEFFVNSLGIVWDKQSMVRQIEGSDKSIDKLFIPLSIAVNPDLMDYVRKQFNMGSTTKARGPTYIGGGDYMPKPNEEIKSLGDLSKDDFMRMLGKKPRK